MAKEYLARVCKPLNEEEKKARMLWIQKKREEMKENDG